MIHPQTQCGRTPTPATFTEWRAESGAGRCGGRAIQRVEGWDQGDSEHPRGGRAPGGEFCFPGVGVPGAWAAPGWEGVPRVEGCSQGVEDWGQRAGSGGWGRAQGGTICFPGVGGPGQRTGAGTSHRVLQQGAGGGRAPPCSRGAGRGRAGVTRVRGDRGAGGAPGTPAQCPARGPPPRPTPRRALSRSRGRAMTRPDRGGGAAGRREGPGRDAAVARRRLINLPLGRRRAESEPRTGPGRSGARGPRVHAPPAGLGRSMPPAAARRL